MKIFQTVDNQPQTGSAKLHRFHLFGDADQDMDVPDGDLEFGRMYYKDNCGGYLFYHIAAIINPVMVPTSSVYTADAVENRNLIDTAPEEDTPIHGQNNDYF
jgi:hypothetical protein